MSSGMCRSDGSLVRGCQLGEGAVEVDEGDAIATLVCSNPTVDHPMVPHLGAFHRLALEHLQQFDLARYSHEPFLPRIWDLRSNLTAYDAAYVSLAESLDAPLLTCDAKLATAPGTSARIELFGA